MKMNEESEEPDWDRLAAFFGRSVPAQHRHIFRRACTHRSASEANYERLEFLGDAVLRACVADRLYAGYPDAPPGELTLMITTLVSDRHLAALAREYTLWNDIVTDESIDTEQLQQTPRILADVVEALIGALYHCFGYLAARAFVQRHLLFDSTALDLHSLKDPKNRLQEFFATEGGPVPSYHVIGRTGEDHAPQFEVEVRVEGVAKGTGVAASKREAQRRAAGDALTKLEIGTDTKRR